MVSRGEEPTPASAASRTHVDSVSWEDDEETGGLVHMLFETDAVQIGLFKPGTTADRTIEVRLEANETLLVLAGTAQLEVDGGTPIQLRAGDLISLPKGAQTIWVVDQAFRELWIYSS